MVPESEKTVEYLRDRLAALREEVATAARRSGRAPEAVRLVAVTKTHSAAVLQAAVQAGVREIGENYLREAEDKFRTLHWPEVGAGAVPVVRHAIGHIQGNKACLALRWFDVIETVDSLALAERLNRLAGESGRTVPVLLQVNISADSAKFGFLAEELAGVLPAMANLAHIRVNGLMTIGRFEPDPEAARPDFVALRELRDRLRGSAPPTVALHDLSMGMSHDFAVAIEEGATIVRVGSRLFGPRGPLTET
ncbi:MAG TPA: YggS family pyridoxal phosphate-dependent enzyme [Armatimonadota bacterium]|jgi:hypothetical protein